VKSPKLSLLSVVQRHTHILCQNLMVWALLPTVESAQPVLRPVFSGGCVPRSVPFWWARSERHLSASVS